MLALTAAGVLFGLAAAAIGDSGDALADRKNKRRVRVSQCVDFDQERGSDELSVELRLSNTCDVPVSCELRWQLECGSRNEGRETRSFSLALTESRGFTASAAVCGEAAWSVKDVRWHCRPE